MDFEKEANEAFNYVCGTADACGVFKKGDDLSRKNCECRYNIEQVIRRAYAAGQENMRAQSRSFEPPLTCPHIDRFLSSNAASDELKAELQEIKAINSQLRWSNWHLQLDAHEKAPKVNEFTPLATTKDIGLE